jgi:hypothetical protein
MGGLGISGGGQYGDRPAHARERESVHSSPRAEGVVPGVDRGARTVTTFRAVITLPDLRAATNCVEAEVVRNTHRLRCGTGADPLPGITGVTDTVQINESRPAGFAGYDESMAKSQQPDRDECIEQAYFFRNFRERLAENLPAQDILSRLHEELLTSTRLPMAVQFLATELKHTGLLASGFARLSHYFTPFQSFVIRQAEEEGLKFTMAIALLLLEREALYKANAPTPPGLFVYQFEAIARNRLGYDEGLQAVERDPFYDDYWKAYIDVVRRQVGTFDFADLVYVRSELYVTEKRRIEPGFVPPVPPLFAEKEGKIAKASRGRDPLFLFAALQRQLGYPEVPRAKPADDITKEIDKLKVKLRELEARLRMAESEIRGTFDPLQFGKPDMFRDIKDED